MAPDATHPDRPVAGGPAADERDVRLRRIVTAGAVRPGAPVLPGRQSTRRAALHGAVAIAGVRIWLEVTNPNPFGFTLSTVTATLALDGTRAATGDFPLGLPLTAGQRSVVPLDLAISFADLPGLAGVLRQMAGGGEVDYELEGTVGVDAGRLGTPTFGPMLLTRGEVRVVR